MYHALVKLYFNQCINISDVQSVPVNRQPLGRVQILDSFRIKQLAVRRHTRDETVAVLIGRVAVDVGDIQYLALGVVDHRLGIFETRRFLDFAERIRRGRIE